MSEQVSRWKKRGHKGSVNPLRLRCPLHCVVQLSAHRPFNTPRVILINSQRRTRRVRRFKPRSGRGELEFADAFLIQLNFFAVC